MCMYNVRTFVVRSAPTIGSRLSLSLYFALTWIIMQIVSTPEESGVMINPKIHAAS